MNAAERRIIVLAAIALALGAGCASLPAPRDYVPKPDEAPQNVRGSWVNVRYQYHEGVRATTSGELLAVTEDSIYVATSDVVFLGPARYSWRDVSRVQVVYFDPQESACYGGAALGAASSLAHGWYSVFTLPIWLIVGASTGSGRVGEAVLTYPNETSDWRDLHAYARFPAGMPGAFAASPDSARVAPPPIAATPAPVAASPIPAYKPARRQGNGIVIGGGTFEDGKGAWSIGYHGRMAGEVFLVGGYTKFDDDVHDMEQVWGGFRLGDPAFIGVKYIYSWQPELPVEFVETQNDGHGVSIFGGFLMPTSRHVAVGAMGGYDWTGLDDPYREMFWWLSAMLQVTLFPAPEP
jgi:hypothetical protein